MPKSTVLIDPEIIKNSRERTVAVIKKLLATKNPKLMSLIYGDPHTGNTYPGSPQYPNWQTFHIGSLFHDLAYFVIGAMSVEDRRTLKVVIIGHYLKSVASFGGPSISTDDENFMKEYSNATIAGMGCFSHLIIYSSRNVYFQCVSVRCSNCGGFTEYNSTGF